MCVTQGLRVAARAAKADILREYNSVHLKLFSTCQNQTRPTESRGLGALFYFDFAGRNQIRTAFVKPCSLTLRCVYGRHHYSSTYNILPQQRSC